MLWRGLLIVLRTPIHNHLQENFYFSLKNLGVFQTGSLDKRDHLKVVLASFF